MFDSSLLSFLLPSVLLIIFAFIYTYWCPTWFPCQMMFMTGVTSGAGIAYPVWSHEFTMISSGIRVPHTFVCFVVFLVFCRSLFVLLSFYFWSLHFISFFLTVYGFWLSLSYLQTFRINAYQLRWRLWFFPIYVYIVLTQVLTDVQFKTLPCYIWSTFLYFIGTFRMSSFIRKAFSSTINLIFVNFLLILD
jgi:hypothetical protein